MTQEISKLEINQKALKTLENRLAGFVQASISQSTKKAYLSDWTSFHHWCVDMGLAPLPATPQTVALYCAERSKTHKVSSMSRFLTAISKVHEWSSLDNPCDSVEVKTVLAGIKRTLGTRRTKAEPITWEILKRMIDKCKSTVLGCRDAAILSVGWAGAFRRSELVGLTIDDIGFHEEGVLITIRRSKTDQEGQGQTIAVPRSGCRYCPVERLSTWVSRMQIDDGPLFFALKRNSDSRMFQKILGEKGALSHLMVNNIVKKYAKIIGLNPKHFSSHSLRRGLATEAGRLMVPERIVMRHTRHKSVDTLRGYMESGKLFEENPLMAVYLSDRSA